MLWDEIKWLMSSPSPKYSNVWMSGAAQATPNFGTHESDPQKHIYMETTAVSADLNHQSSDTSPNSSINATTNPLRSQPNGHANHLNGLSPASNGYMPIADCELPHQQLPHQQLPQSISSEHHLHHHLHHHDGPPAEFLPLCDLLFNIISLAAYFCDVVFDIVTVYTLYLSEEKWWAPCLFFIILSSVTSQWLSLKWYARREPRSNKKQIDWRQPRKICVAVTHFLQLGILWRYFR